MKADEQKPTGGIDFNKWSSHCLTSVRRRRSWIYDYTIDRHKKYLPKEFLLRVGGVGILPRGDIQIWGGRAKSGKSFALSIIETAVLTGKYFGLVAEKPDLKVLHIDTSMSKSDVAKRAKTVHALCNDEQGERYLVLNLREINAQERKEYLREGLKRFKPDLCVVDGVRDLLKDFSNLRERSELICELLALNSQYNCALCLVLYHNYGVELGEHFFDFTTKASEVYAVSNKDGVTTVEQEFCRNAPADKWGFSIDGDGKPQQVEQLRKADI